MSEIITVIRINKASPKEHLDKIALLEQLNFSSPWTKDMLLRAFADWEKVFFAAVCDGQLVGYIGAQLIVDELDIFNVCVDASFRRRGIGRLLVQTLKNVASNFGALRLTLEVRASNAPAIALYESMGFYEAGRRKNYYTQPREDAVLMDCIL